MPTQSAIDKQLGLVIGKAWGRITFAEMTAHQDKLLSDPDFNPMFNQFVDGSKVTDWCVSIDEAEIAAAAKCFCRRLNVRS